MQLIDYAFERFRYLILQDPDWNYLDYKFNSYDKEMKYAAAYPAINDYMRLYLLPGVLHCGGGEGS